jgi:hypothetical protein
VNDLASRRLEQQRLTYFPFSQPAEVVAWLGVVQAQDYPAALWAVGLRLPGSVSADVEKAIQQRRVVRSWLMRGTLHFVTPDDLGWMLELFAPGVIARSARRYRQLELDETTLTQSTKLIIDALHDRDGLTRRELFALLNAQGLSTKGQRGVYMLMRASLEGRIAQGIQSKGDPAFFLLERALPPLLHLEYDEALAELARRYFTGHGPAALDDFRWWSGLPAAEARAALDMAKAHLHEETIDGRTYWHAGQSTGAARAAPTAHLLPAYDEFLIGYKDRSASLAPEHAAYVKNANGLGSAILLAGQVIGTWTRTTKRAEVVIHAAPFMRWSKAQQEAVEQAVQAYGRFMSKAATLNIQSSISD